MSLRTRALRGGAYLALRQGLGVGINFLGIILLTRAIGPANYGLYAAAMGIFIFLQLVTDWGISIYLVRQEGEVHIEVYHQAFTLLLLLSTVATLLALLAIPLLEEWLRLAGFSLVALTLFLSLPAKLLWNVPLARLERALDYRKIAVFELTGLFSFHIVALPLAFGGFGVAAPLLGWWAQQVSTLAVTFLGARYWPRLHWDYALVKQMVRYGLGFSASIWVWQLRELVNPLVVARYGGAEAVAYVALAIRLVRGLSFVKEAMWRISMPALAMIQRHRDRLVRAVSEGMNLQVLGQGPLLVGFAWTAPWILPTLLGSEWSSVIVIYPFIALGYLVNSVFNLHSSALYVLQRNWKVTAFHLVHIVLFAGVAFVMVPQIGLIGYGWAEVAALGSYALIHFYVVREIGAPAYKVVGVWGVAFALALFVNELGWWAALGLVVVILWPQTWREINSYVKGLWDGPEK